MMLLLTACSVGPKYKRPAVTAPPAFRGVQPGPSTDEFSLADLKWFEVFKDEELQRIIRTALAGNHDLRLAVARVEGAQASLGITRADQMPAIGASTNLTSQQTSASGQFDIPQQYRRTRTFGAVALNLLSFEIDIWGKLRKATEAARAEMLASEENRKTVVTMLVGDVAAAYFDLLALDAELDIARRTLETRRASLELVRKREQRGLASLLEVRQAEQLVQTAAQAVPSIEQQIETQENQISFLMGRSPGQIPRGRRLTDQDLPPDVPAGIPSELLTRRPDILAAEQNLIAANANIGAARAAFFPQISLTSFVGSQSNQLTSLFAGPARAWQFVPQVTQPLFTGGRVRSNMELAKANQKLALVAYERAIQTAFRESADALVQHRKTREIRAEQERLVETLKDRSRLSYLRYRGGVDTLLSALDADRDLFTAEVALAQARRNELVALVQVYRALGGGWQ